MWRQAKCCSSGLASSDSDHELFYGTTTGIQLYLGRCRIYFPLNRLGVCFGFFIFTFCDLRFMAYNRYEKFISNNRCAPMKLQSYVIFFIFYFFILFFYFLFFIYWIHLNKITADSNKPFPAPGVPPPPNPGWGGLKWSRDPPDFSYANSA